MIEAHIEIDSLGPLDAPPCEEDVNRWKCYATMREAIADIGILFPLDIEARDNSDVTPVSLGQHNGAGLNLGCIVQQPGAGRRRLKVYLCYSELRPCDDDLWAEAVEELVRFGALVEPGNAPSSREWSMGVTGHGRSVCLPSSEARLRVCAAVGRSGLGENEFYVRITSDTYVLGVRGNAFAEMWAGQVVPANLVVKENGLEACIRPGVFGPYAAKFPEGQFDVLG